MLVARQHGLVFNVDKYNIKETKITFFGMLFDAEGVHPDPEKVEAIRAIQEPQDTPELQTFFGIATYMVPFIPNLSAMSEPPRNLLKKDTDFQWSPSHKTAFENIKQSICREVSLTYFDPEKESVVQVDASLRGLGSALVQEGKVVAFAFRALTDTEKSYANIEREMLAVVVACEKFHSYLLGKKFTVKLQGIFHKERGFQHITSSPRYPQSNGFIGRQVQTVKHTLDKAKKSGQDPHMSLPCLRSTPVDSQLPSPAELLYQRKLQSNLPIRVGNQYLTRTRLTSANRTPTANEVLP